MNKNNKIICLILAGGFHQRISHIIGNTPKVLLEYKGKPLIDHLIEKIPKNIPIFITTNEKFNKDFNEWKKTIKRRSVSILFEKNISKKEKMGAVSSIDYWIKSRNIEEDLLVIAGDNYFGFNLNDFLKSYDNKTTLIAIYDIKDKKRASDFGVLTVKDREVVSFEEKPKKPKSSLISVGCYIFPKETFPILSDFCKRRRDNLGDFIDHLLKKQKINSYLFKDRWFDIGTEIKKGNNY
jgi:glucose-1-phosphate thymidylyltransferase